MKICKENNWSCMWVTILQGSHLKVASKQQVCGGAVVSFLCSWGHSLIPPGLIGRLRYGGKMSDLVVAVLQLPCCSSRNSPAEPLAVRPGAFGGGIFKQAFSNQPPHTNQVPISDLWHKMKVERNTKHCGNTPECLFFILMVTNFHTTLSN